MKEITLREEDNALMADFKVLENWDSFDEIISLLKSRYRVEIEAQLDGPDSRVWMIKINGVSISLHNNPYGNFLKGRSGESKELIRQIAENW